MRKITLFLLCKEPDGYQVFYDYKKNKLYGCYTAKEEVQPDYGIFLVQPFLILALTIFCDWAVSLEIWGQWLIRLLAVIAATIMIKYFWEKLSEKTENVRNSRMRELSNPTEIEWRHFLCQADKQLKRQSPYYVMAALGMLGSAITFVCTRGLIFLGVYSLLFFIACPFLLIGSPLRKYKFIRNGGKM